MRWGSNIEFGLEFICQETTRFRFERYENDGFQEEELLMRMVLRSPGSTVVEKKDLYPF